MLVDVVMFLLMGLAVAYLVARMGDGASLALVAYAAALLSVVGLSFLLAALGAQLEGSYDVAITRFVASLVGAFIGTRLAARQRTSIAAGGDLPIWIGDPAVGPVLAAVVVVGIMLLELNRLGLGLEPTSKSSTGAAWTPTALPTDKQRVVPGTGAAATPSLSEYSEGQRAQPAPLAERTNRDSPARLNNPVATAPAKSAQKTGSNPSPGSTKSISAGAASEARTSNDAEPIAVANATHGAPAAQRVCNDWSGFANMIRTCVVTPCEQCRGQQEMRHALTDNNVEELAHGFVDCNSLPRSAIEFGSRCIAADNKRALFYARFFLVHPHAPVPKSP